MLCHMYLDRRTGTVLVPRTAKTEAGYWLDVEPVKRASVDDPASISHVLREAIEHEELIVASPTRAMFPKPVVLAHSTARSWSDFEKRNVQFSLLRTPDGRFRIERYQKAPEGVGVIVDEAASKTFTQGASIDEVTAELLSMMRSKQ